ncbi:MAG: metallophosphoesterase family protein [Phycisphaeraceae bacterium]|nr:MAG: metallophosphoesterase family protein [Phycisphaeraceae bacterium]
MPTAVISDIHANVSALNRVLADIASRGITRVVCLGDTVGYGPDPLECVDLVRKHCVWSLMGNHDFAVLYEPTNFNAGAETAAYWTREQFDKEADAQLRADRYEFLGRLRVRVVDQPPDLAFPILAVHGSPRRPINEYIFPDDPQNQPDKLESIFDRVPRLCVVGHTHVPGVFTDEPDFYPPDELGERGYVFREDEKAVINVGSVGQPRDHDPKASYVILHPDRAEFVRIPYDIEATAAKMRKIPQLPPWLVDRLFDGR